MSCFKYAQHLSSWTGLSPGNNKSADKIESSRTCFGNEYVKTILCECAHGAEKEKHSYLGSKYWTLKSRIGKPRAIIAISRTIIVAIWYMLTNNEEFTKVDRETYSNTIAQKQEKNMIKKLQKLGYKVGK